jgi:hypothetical protein
MKKVAVGFAFCWFRFSLPTPHYRRDSAPANGKRSLSCHTLFSAMAAATTLPLTGGAVPFFPKKVPGGSSWRRLDPLPDQGETRIVATSSSGTSRSDWKIFFEAETPVPPPHS